MTTHAATWTDSTMSESGGGSWTLDYEFDNPLLEKAYWAYWDKYLLEGFAENAVLGYQEHLPAYRYGWESGARWPGSTFDDRAANLEEGWEEARTHSTLAWYEARHAVRDGWDRGRASVGC